MTESKAAWNVNAGRPLPEEADELLCAVRASGDKLAVQAEASAS